MKAFSIKAQLILFLVCFASYLSFIDKKVIFLFSTSIAVISAVLIDSLLNYLKQKKFLITESSIISGLIIGYVLSSDNAWWIFSLTSIIAICSKYLISFNKKHIFNPAAFGIFLSIILLGSTTAWKGTYLWYVLLPAGIYFVHKIRKLEILFSYFLTFFVLFGIQVFVQKTSILNIFGYLSYFYIFIMVIEPKTSPIKPIGKFVFGMGVSILIFILTEVGVRFDAELCSLLILNLSVPFLNKLENF